MQKNNLTKIQKTFSIVFLTLVTLFFYYTVATAQGGLDEEDVYTPGNTHFDQNGEDTTNPVILNPQTTEPVIDPKVYTLLQPIGEVKTFDPTGKCPFVKYLDAIIKIFIGIAAVLAMIMIITGGIQYMTSGAVSGKKDGLDKLQNALLGLLIALGAWIILNTINPNLLNFCFNLPDADVQQNPNPSTGSGSGGGGGGGGSF